MTAPRLRGGGLVLLSLFAILVAVGSGWRATVPAPAAPPARAEAATGPRAPAVDPSELSSFEVRPGWRAAQIALALEHAGVDGARFAELVEEGDLEGYLFPGVYELRESTTVEELVAEMTGRFDEVFNATLRERAKEIGLSVREVTTLASIVEREVARYSEAPVVAGVFTNRLRRGIALKADPTVIYVLESGRALRSYWTTSPRSGDGLGVDSPYNTYRYRGLPPGPIASPSKASLLAALYPARVEDLYFVAKPTGAHDFSRTGKEHVRKRSLLREGAEELRPENALQQFVERIMEPVDGDVGVYIRNLATGETAWLNPDEFFTAASLYKLAVLVTAFEHRERGLLSFSERLSITPAVADEDYPRLRARLGRRPTVRKAVEDMIVVSSNAAGVTLLNRFGRGEVTRVIRAYGLRDTHFSRARILTTPHDAARLLEAIARGRAVSPRASREMLAILSRQEIRDRLPKYLPKRVRIANKTGTLDYPSHDAGILFTRRGPVVIAALTENATSGPVATESLALLGRLVFDYYGELPRAQAAVGALRERACPGGDTRPPPGGPLAGQTVLLDPAHGGRATGVVFNGLTEEDVALDVALRLRRLLLARGAIVRMTRCRDAFVSALGRAALANAARADAVVSIHLHGSRDPTDDGVQVGAALPDGRVLARSLLGTFAQPGLWDVLRARGSLPNRGERPRRSWLTLYSFAPAAQVEPVFLSNRDEARWLRRGGGRRDEIARGLLRGLLNYFDVPAAATRPQSVRQVIRSGPSPASKVRIAATGDIALGGPMLGPVPPFGSLRSALSGDVVLGNLEGTLALGGVSKCAGGAFACYAFRAPPWSAGWLAQAGFTVLNLANNHSNDYGPSGRAETVLALDGAGLQHTGRPGQIARETVKGVRVALLGFAPYSSSGDLLDVEAAAERVRNADQWADVVIVTMHAGAEGAEHEHVRPGPESYLGEARGDPVRFAHAVVDAGADLVVGHGPHVVRGLEWYRGRLVAYSLGNFAGSGTLGFSGALGAGAILQATLRGDGTWSGGRIVPVRLAGLGAPEPDARADAVTAMRRLSRADFGLRGMRLASDGTLNPPRGP